MLGGLIFVFGMLISGKLVTKAMRELKRHHPETFRKHRFLLTISFLAVYGYCIFLCVLIGAAVNGSLDSSTVLLAQKLIAFLFLAGFGGATLSAATAHFLMARKAPDGNPKVFKRGLFLLLLGIGAFALLFFILQQTPKMYTFMKIQRKSIFVHTVELIAVIADVVFWLNNAVILLFVFFSLFFRHLFPDLFYAGIKWSLIVAVISMFSMVLPELLGLRSRRERTERKEDDA